MTRISAITMPKWGIEMQEGTIAAWHAPVGRTLGKGDPLLDVETEKIVNSVESPFAGTLRRILAEPGETRAVGALIGVFADAEVADSEVDAFIASFTPPDTSFEYGTETALAASAASPTPASNVESIAPSGEEGEVRVSPIARRLAEHLGVDLSKIKGTGRHGRISKEDVEAAHAAMQSVPPSSGSSPPPAPVSRKSAPEHRSPASGTGSGNEPVREALSAMRLTIARRLVESKQTIPHYRLSADVDASALLARRAQLKASGISASVTDLLLRICGLALARHPQVNAQLDGQTLLKYSHADIAIAVATDAGLVTPIVRTADLKSIAEISAETRELIARAQSGKLAREEIAGGTFTLSNLGMLGVDRFDAIINPPQVGILAVGAAREQPVVYEGAVRIGRVLSLTFAFDHRVVDGAVGARFVETVRELLRKPDAI